MPRSVEDPECARHAELLSAAVDDELDPLARRNLDAHLERCPACRTNREALARWRRRLLMAPAPRLDPLLARIGPARLAAAASRRVRIRRIGMVAALCSVVVGVLVGVFALRGGSGSGPWHTADAEPPAGRLADSPHTTVTLAGERSDRDLVVVDRGTRVRWVNDDPDVHHLVIHSPGATIDNVLAPADTESVTFTEPGTFRFDCLLHPSVTGTVTVL